MVAQDQAGTPEQRAHVEKMIHAIRIAILDASPPVDKDKHFVDFDALLSAMAHVIAAVAVHGANAAENRAATKSFVRLFAQTVEQNVKAIRESGQNPFFAEAVNAIYRKDQRH